jgi:hypothetical protein
MTIRASTLGATNVVAGWLGVPVPAIPKQRNQTRANYRKTGRKREPRVVPACPRNEPERTPA